MSIISRQANWGASPDSKNIIKNGKGTFLTLIFALDFSFLKCNSETQPLIVMVYL